MPQTNLPVSPLGDLGTGSAGVWLSYADTVPNGAVNLAYVDASMDSPFDIVNIQDDLADGNKYAANNLAAAPYTLTILHGQVIDPQTGAAWIGPTDNVLFTTVTSTITAKSGAQKTLPLFYKQNLRLPIPDVKLPASLYLNIFNGFSLDSTMRPNPLFAQLNDLVTITNSDGSPIPKGYLYEVLPLSLDEDGNLFITVYTNFRSTYKQEFIVSWAGYSETLNVSPVYWQHPSTPDNRIYVANPVANSGVTFGQSSFSNTDSPSIVLSTPGLSRTAPVALVSTATINVSDTNAANTKPIPTGTYNAGYYSNANGVNGIAQFGYPNPQTYYLAHATSYQTGATTAAPVDNGSAITVSLTNISCSQDNHGDGYVVVSIYNPNGVNVKSGTYTNNTQRVASNGVQTGIPSAFTATGTASLSYFDPAAIPGIYTIYIGGTSNSDYNVQQNLAPNQNYGIPGTYTYPVSWQGSYGWSGIVQSIYSATDGPSITFQTTSTTQSPGASASELKFLISNIYTPADSYGSSSITLDLYSPAGVKVFTQPNIRTPQTITYMGSGGAGVWTWSARGVASPTYNGTSSYKTSIAGSYSYYESSSATTTTFVGVDGNPILYTTPQNTVAPTAQSRQLQLQLTGVSAGFDSVGASSLQVQLRSPAGNIVLTQSGIVASTTVAYYDANAISGVYTWSVTGIATPNASSAISTYLDTWSGNHSYYTYNTVTAGDTSAGRTVGFNFSTTTTDGVIYACTDNGPQIYLQEPDNTNSRENWYLKIHRGWLSYTDTNDSTYLVGLAPYYKQNFGPYIPLIKSNMSSAKIVKFNQVSLRHTPIVVDAGFPIDIVLTRNGTDTWLTRDNGLNTGNYVPTVIQDISAAKGLVTINDVYLNAGDSVHAVYWYSEYYLSYRGFPDAFGRWIHLDVNPAAGHTFTDIWNLGAALASGVTTQAASGTSSPNVELVNMQTFTTVQDSQAVSGSSTATITNSTQNLPVPTLQSTTVNQAGTASIAVASIQGTLQTLAIAGSGAVSINQAGLPTSSSTTSFSVVATSAPTASASAISITISSITSTAPYGAFPNIEITLLNPSSVPVATWNHSNYGGASQYNIPYTVNYFAPSAAAGTWTVQVSAYPISGGAPVPQGYNFSYTGSVNYYVAPVTVYVNQNGTSSSWTLPADTIPPRDPTTELSFNITTLTTPSDSKGHSSYVVELLDPSNTVVLTQSNITAPVTITYYSSSALTGTYTWTAYSTCVNTNSGVSSYATSLTATQSLYRSIPTATTVYIGNNGSSNSYTTPSQTMAPVNSTTALSLIMTSVNVPTGTGGSVASYNVTLTNPAGTIVNTWRAIAAPVAINYSDPAAIGGQYTWNAYASVTPSASPVTTSFACTMSGNIYWAQEVTSTHVQYSNHVGAQTIYATDPNTAAPRTAATQLSFDLTSVQAPVDIYGASFLYVELHDSTDTVVQTWPTIISPQVLTYYSEAALAGSYRWIFYGVSQSSSNGISSYHVTWNGQYSWYEFASTTSLGQSPNYLLVNRSLYMYLTTDGYPFHAVLNPTDDPTQPLVYDTNGAMAGTRYALVPTIHAF